MGKIISLQLRKKDGISIVSVKNVDMREWDFKANKKQRRNVECSKPLCVHSSHRGQAARQFDGWLHIQCVHVVYTYSITLYFMNVSNRIWHLQKRALRPYSR